MTFIVVSGKHLTGGVQYDILKKVRPPPPLTSTPGSATATIVNHVHKFSVVSSIRCITKFMQLGTVTFHDKVYFQYGSHVYYHDMNTDLRGWVYRANLLSNKYAIIFIYVYNIVFQMLWLCQISQRIKDYSFPQVLCILKSITLFYRMARYFVKTRSSFILWCILGSVMRETFEGVYFVWMVFIDVVMFV